VSSNQPKGQLQGVAPGTDQIRAFQLRERGNGLDPVQAVLKRPETRTAVRASESWGKNGKSKLGEEREFTKGEGDQKEGEEMKISLGSWMGSKFERSLRLVTAAPCDWNLGWIPLVRD
jgi:hypothetical protein